MTWHINLLLVPLFTILACIHLTYHDPNIATSSTGLLLTSVALLLQYITREFKLVAFISVLLGTILCQTSIYVISDSQIISDMMWIILVSFYSFYLLGSKIGAGTLIINIGGLLLYFGLGFSQYAEVNVDDSINIKTAVNVSIVTIVIAFIIHKIISTSENVNQELQTANEQLKIQNEEKSILLKEIHHRVKNNLQLISSLLRLQVAEIDDPLVEEHFTESINRIKSMALIHEKMYQDDDLAKLDLYDYLVSLSDDIILSVGGNKKINIDITTEIHEINVKNVVPLALILNELIVNSIKHGFKNETNGNINLKVVQVKDTYQINYSDNGTWVEPNESRSFGTELIQTLCEQMDGTCQRNVDQGTHYNLSLNIAH